MEFTNKIEPGNRCLAQSCGGDLRKIEKGGWMDLHNDRLSILAVIFPDREWISLHARKVLLHTLFWQPTSTRRIKNKREICVSSIHLLAAAAGSRGSSSLMSGVFHVSYTRSSLSFFLPFPSASCFSYFFCFFLLDSDWLDDEWGARKANPLLWSFTIIIPLLFTVSWQWEWEDAECCYGDYSFPPLLEFYSQSALPHSVIVYWPGPHSWFTLSQLLGKW